MHLIRRSAVALAATMLVLLSIGPGIALAVDVQHGIGLTKGCTSPTKIGDPYTCAFQVRNILDEAEDTLTIFSIVDVVHAASGDVNSGNILGSVRVTTVDIGGNQTGSTCAAASGSGTVADPYLGVTSCTLPFNSRVTILPYSHYTVQAGDFALPNHQLRDDVSLGWTDLCNDPAGTGNSNCDPTPPANAASSLTLIQQLVSSTATDIHNAAHQVVTAVAVGTTVHDLVTVTGQPGAPVPTGNVNIDWFLNGDCTGAPAQNSGSVGPLAADGTFDATGFNFTVNTAGFRAFRAHYEGDATYTGSDGPCEPLRVVDANIQITPDGVNRVGAPHTFSGHVNIDDGTGFVNAPDGTVITFTTVDALGATSAPNPPPQCTTSGGTGSCATTITSPTTGTSTVSAHTTVTVAGVSLTRDTDGVGANSGPAVKTWVNATIAIAPNAFNEVGVPHTFTATLMKDPGTGVPVPAAGETVTITLTSSNGACPAPPGPFTGTTDAAGHFSATFTSTCPGTVTGHASSTLSVGGSAPFTIDTDNSGGNSGDATKVFQDANIQITPNGTNRVGAPHTFTAHVNANLGDGAGFVNAPDGTVITFTTVDALGATSAPNPPTSCTTSGGTGSCSTTISSPTTGTSTVSAHTTFTTPGGVILTRSTDGVGLNSGPAVKTWVNARISIAPNATNEVNDPHTFTVTLEKDLGDGAGFVAAAGESVTVTLANSNGATATPAGPFTGTTDAAGQFAVTFTSPTPGQVTGTASWTGTLGTPTPFTVTTDGTGGSSGPAVKTFVDANIQITPNGTNRVGAPHTFTAHVNVNAGLGAGYVNAPDGTVITFTTIDNFGATSAPNPPTQCTTSGGTGSCSTTITSPTTGTSTVFAHATVVVGGVTLTRDTDGIGANSGPAVKTWVNATIAIAPNAFNEVGVPHTFTATLMKDPGTGVPVPAAGETVTITLTSSNGACPAPPGPFTGTTDAAGHFSATFTSTCPGTVTGHASSTLSVGGSAPFTIDTDNSGGNSGDATKVFQDANIQITPNGTNRVGAPHTFTAHVNANLGDGAGFVNAPDGTVITFTTVDANGATSAPNPPTSCTTSGGTGSCSTTISSPTTGTSTVSAHTTFTTPGGVTLTRSTDGVGLNSGPAVKTWVNARISIAPTATNEINDPHTFTVTLQRDNGDGTGFVAFAGAHVDFSLTDSLGAGFVLNAAASTCDDAGANTDAAGQCVIVFTSPTPGQVTGTASWTGSLGTPTPFTVTTDGTGGSSGPAVKTFVDANIQITPNGTNRVGAPHTFTAHVNVNAGLGAGYVNAPDGTVITFTTIDNFGATSTPNPPTQCTTSGGTGSCSTTITSPTTGTSTVFAHATVVVGGVTLTRDTDGIGANSGPAVKTWVNATIAIAPNAFNEVGVPHTFTATLMKDPGTGVPVPAAGETVTITLTSSNGACPAPPGPFTGTTDAAGHFSATFTSTCPGTVTGHASSTLSVGGSAPFTIDTDNSGGNSGDATKVFQDANIQITPNGTNRVGAPHTFTAHVNANLGQGAGFQNAPDGTVITFTTVDALGATSAPNPPTSCTTSGGTGSCTTTISSPTTGTSTVSAHTTFTTPGGVTLTRSTDGVGANSVPAVKTWVNARISITPTATNEINAPHTFTVFLERDNGDGTGFVAFAGAHVDFSLTDSLGAGFVLDAAASTCDDAGANTDAAGQCVIVFTSPTPGQVTGTASWTGTLGTPTPFTVTTDGTGGSSGPAVKTFVDANIQIVPDATNRVGAPHTFTAHVNVNAGLGAGFVSAPDGTVITFTTIDNFGATSAPNPPTQCTTSGGTGSCSTTISSPTTGTSTVFAHTTVVVGGVTLTRDTDAIGANSGPAVKTWVNARIAITPNAFNEVTHPHTFFVTVSKDTGTGTYVPAAGEHVDFTLTSSLGAAAVLDAANSTCDNAGANTDATGTCTITFVSATAGTVTGHATATLSVAGSAPFTVSTDGQGGSSGDATKVFQDANIQITPNGTNRVGASHTFTAHVNANLGQGAGFQNAPDGTVITFTTVDALGATSTPNPPTSCTTSGGTGSCSTTISSPTTGTSTVSAHTTFTTPGGVVLTRSTDGVGANSVPAVKTWVNARISIAPNATNEINAPHTFTVTLQRDNGDGTGFVAFAGAHVDFSLTDSLGAGFVLNAAASTCDDAGANTDAAGQCVIVFTSPTPGQVTGTASWTGSLGTPTPFTVTTDGTGGSSGPAVKTFVDANIQITPDATNRVGAPHTFTAHVNVNAGLGAGYVSAPDGTVITFTTIDNFGATSAPNPPTQCTTSGGTGSCSTTITSPTTGTSTVFAHTTLAVGGVALTRDTDGVGANSGPAVKTWVNARISIAPNATNEVNDPHTFTVTLQRDNGDGAGFVAFSGAHVSVTLANSSGAGFVLDAAASTCDDAGANTNAAGQCVIVFTSPTPGQVTGTASWTGSLGTPTPFTVTTDGTGGSSGPAVKTFVDANLQISPLTDNNPVSTNHTLTGHVNVNAGLGAGYVNAPAGTVIDFSLTNAGGATAAFVGPSTCATVGTTGSCTVVISSPTTGTTTIGAVTTVTVGGVSLHRETGDGLPGDSADAVKRWADDTVRTDVHNAAHTVITKVAVGTVVHDKVFVTRTAATPVEVPNPTGSVVFHRYANLTCTGTAVDQTVALGADGTAESASFTTTGDLCYRADYLGDANYPARSGANEPLRVIRPATSLTTVGTPVTKVKTGDVVTITINEKNVGDDPISDVHVTGGSTGGTVDCTWAPVDPAFDGTLDPGESQDFFCTFTVGTAQLSWEALGQGTNSLGNPVDDDGEYLSAMPETAGITPFSRPAGAGLSPWLSLAAVAILLIGLAFITPVPARVRRRTR